MKKMYIIKYYCRKSKTYHWIENIKEENLQHQIMSSIKLLDIYMDDIKVYEAEEIKLSFKFTTK